MEICNESLENYFECNYKSYLKQKGARGKKNNLEKFEIRSFADIKRGYLRGHGIYETYPDSLPGATQKIRAREAAYLNGIEVPFGRGRLSCDLLKLIKAAPESRQSFYLPVMLAFRAFIPKSAGIILSAIAAELEAVQGVPIPFGEIIFMADLKCKRIDLYKYRDKPKEVLKEIYAPEEPVFHLNAHCSHCEFRAACLKKALALDHPSLLKGVGRKRISELAAKGIFTVNQLSYTFRPRRRQNVAGSGSLSRSAELHALAIREKQVYILNSPAVVSKPDGGYFLDVEGLPDGGYYLIGLLAKNHRVCRYYNFWSDSPACTMEMLNGFLSEVDKFPAIPIYHYGNYEKVFLLKMKKRFSHYADRIDSILSRLRNVLLPLHNQIYFPTYSNSLKDIARFLGFDWSDPDASGLESIYWRKSWEKNGDQLFKQRLITYNKEDCLALNIIQNAIYALTSKDFTGFPSLKVSEAAEIQHPKKNIFITEQAFFQEIEIINSCSYFDYQQSRVHTHQSIPQKKNDKKARGYDNYFYQKKPDRTLQVSIQKCEHCGSLDICRTGPVSKKLIELVFMSKGVKRSLVEYHANYYRCRSCRRKYLPSKYPASRLKVGYSLICWTIYQHIENRQSFQMISKTLFQLFHIRLSAVTLSFCKEYLLRYHEKTFQNLLDSIPASEVLYVDETPIKLHGHCGYIWVFTNGRQVISIFRESRESGFLKEFLKGFNGVLVTDFYNGYDALECKKQKCLIHLIRDFNSDLVKNPFDEAFKKMALDFSLLLQQIVLAIHRYGLRAYHLKRFSDPARKFLEKVAGTNYLSPVCQQYQVRLKRNRDSLFEFLDPDGVGWNNTNAEHAIKALALHNDKDINSYSISRIDTYLKIMSIYQTCEMMGLEFFDFLRSDNFILKEKRHRKSRHTSKRKPI